MTVSSTTARVDYAGNGVTVLFSVPFPFIQNEYLSVLRINSTTLVSTTLVLDSGGANGYTVTGAGEASGFVTVVTAPTVGERLAIVRVVPATQEADFVANDPFPAETFEDALDKLTMIVGQAVSDVNRALKLFEGDLDGSGRYAANNNRIVGLADGINPTDAATVQQIIAAGSGNFIASGAGAITRTMQDKARDIISTEDYPTLAEAKAAMGNGTVIDPDGISYKDVFNQPLNVFAEGGETAWDGALVLRSSSASAHAADSRVVFAIENRPAGSTVNAPTSADYCLSLSVIKQDWFNTEVKGEIDALNITVRQGGQAGGAKSDCAGILLNVGNVHGVGFACLLEGTTTSFDPGTAAIDRQVQFAAGVLDSFTDDYFGQTVTAVVGVLDTAILANCVGGASWTKYAEFFNSVGASVFSVLANGDLVTAGTVTAVNLRASGAATSAAAGTVVIGGTTSTTATAGAAPALPATPTGYINIFIGGTAAKIPMYLP